MKLLWRLAKEAKHYKWYLVLAAVCLLLLTGVNLLGPRIQTLIIAEIESGLDASSIRRALLLGGALLGVFLIRVAFRFVSNVSAHKAAWNIVKEVRIKLYATMQSFSTEYFASARTGDLMSRVVNDTALFELLYAHLIPETFTNLLTLVGVTVILFTMNAKLALLTCIPIPFILLAGWDFSHRIRPIFRSVQKSTAAMNSQLQDSFSGMQEIRAFGQEKREAEKVNERVAEFTYHQLQSLYKGATFHPWVEFLTSFGTVIVLGVGSWIAYRGGISVVSVVSFLLYLSLFYAPITGLTQLLEQAQNAMAGAERVIEIIDTPVEIKNEEGAQSLDECRGAISFEHVGFHYTEGTPILEDISFSIEPGQFVALVGPTGVGKTTLVKLAARLYDPKSGVVRLDGHDLRELTLESLRKSIAFVPQDTFLFNCTIAENIAFARPDATREEIERAARIARIHNDIVMMPDGYDTMAGERGVKLSGGQKQRIAIARALICGAPVLILDEATSAVDAQTERMIQRSIDELTGSHTIIAIAHRLSTVRNADLILVFENGRIVQRGTHEQLMQQDGLYQRMYSLQSAEIA